MQPFIFASGGTLAVTLGVLGLFLKWNGRLKLNYMVGLSWGLIALSALLFSLAFPADVGISLVMVLHAMIGIGLVCRALNLKAIGPYPEIKPVPSREKERASVSGTLARSLSSVLVAPVAGLGLGLMVWRYTGGHEASKMVMAVVAFFLGMAAFQVMALAAVRPWRASGLLVAFGALFWGGFYVGL